MLGDPAALTTIIPLLDSPDDEIRKQAVRACVWVSRPDTRETLRQSLQHADPHVRFLAALGLAYQGDDSVAPLLFSKEASKILSVNERLAVGLTLGTIGEDQLVAFLDHEQEPARARALLLLLLLEWKSPQGDVARLLACLSSRMPRVRLTAAQALECVADPTAFARFVQDQVNDREDDPAWTIAPQTLDDFAELLVHADPLMRARAARLLRSLEDAKQDAWDLAWSVFAERFAAEIAALREQAKRREPIPPRSSVEELREIAFGAYVGLVREQGGTTRKTPDPRIIRVRQTALNRILSLAQGEPQFAEAARPVLVQSLGDPYQAVRLLAFEHLQTLGIDHSALAAEALASGQTDLGVKGLELLTAGASSTEGQAILERVMLSRKDDLAIEAAKLLKAGRDAVTVAASALEASYVPLRRLAVSWLAAEYDKAPAAADALRQALSSRYQAVREAAALELANKKDKSAFDALVTLLRVASEANRQRTFLAALVALGDPRAPDAFLDRIENDPGGTALSNELIKAAGQFRRPENAERLLAILERDKKYRDAATVALLTISGHDQPETEDDEGEPLATVRPEDQFPRHDDVLARLMDRLFSLGEARLLVGLVPAARRAEGSQVDPVLSLLTAHPEDRIRRDAIEAVGWRLRKRGGPADPLLKALSHKDPISQFLAAEALARAGRGEGLNVLLASIDFVSDLVLRERAVSALGELADERALDTLLKLAAEEGHALQDAAAEAIGHLGRSDKAGEIFRLLERHARSDGSIAETALRGLRWLNTADAWKLIRRRAAEPEFSYQETTWELLGYNDDPATRDLLRRLLSSIASWVDVEELMTSARRLWGRDSLEPDYALLQNPSISYADEFEESLKRICRQGEPRRIFEIVSSCVPDIRETLAVALLNRPELPLNEAREALKGNEEPAVTLAAWIVGRAGPSAKVSKTEMETILQRWRDVWEERRQNRNRARVEIDDDLESDDTDGERAPGTLPPVLEVLIYAAGRLGLAQDQLRELATSHSDDPLFQPIRRRAILELTEGKSTPEAIATLEAAARSNDPWARATAAGALGRSSSRDVPAVAERLLSDRVSFERLARRAPEGLDPVVTQAVRQLHYQGVALPHVVARGDIETLGAVAEDRTLPEATRLGAIEGLAKLASEAAEQRLRQIGLAQEDDEELRKAAWRGLRRSKRSRRQGTAPGAEVRR